MSELLQDDLPVGVRKSGDGQRYEVGVTINGGFLAFAAFTANDFETDLAEFQRQQQEQSEQQQQPQG